MDKIQINGEEMIKEKHIVNGIYGGHQLSRYIDVYEVSANRCHSVPESGYKGTEATLVDEPAWNEKFSSYSITGATLTGNNFILNNDVTAQANYETAKNLTLQTDGHGTIAANKTSGFIGDQVTLSNTPNIGYEFTGYSITGANLTGNKFNFIGNDVTAKAVFDLESVKLGNQYWTKNELSIDDGGDGISTANVVCNGIDFGVKYFYTYSAAMRVANSIDGWHLPTSAELATLNANFGSHIADLKSTAGWYNNGNGTDLYGFNLKPFTTDVADIWSRGRYAFIMSQTSATGGSWVDGCIWGYYVSYTGSPEVRPMVINYSGAINGYPIRLIKG